MFIENLNIYLDHYFNEDIPKLMYKLELYIESIISSKSFKDSVKFSNFKKLCGYITNYILFLYFDKFYEKYVTEKSGLYNIRSI